MSTFKIHCDHTIGNIIQKACMLDERVLFCSYNKEYLLNDYILLNLKTTDKIDKIDEKELLTNVIEKIQKNLLDLNKKFKENI